MKPIDAPLRTLNPRERNMTQLLWLVNLLKKERRVVRSRKGRRREDATIVRKLGISQRIATHQEVEQRAKVQNKRGKIRKKERNLLQKSKKRTLVMPMASGWQRLITSLIFLRLVTPMTEMCCGHKMRSLRSRIC